MRDAMNVQLGRGVWPAPFLSPAGRPVALLIDALGRCLASVEVPEGSSLADVRFDLNRRLAVLESVPGFIPSEGLSLSLREHPEMKVVVR